MPSIGVKKGGVVTRGQARRAEAAAAAADAPLPAPDREATPSPPKEKKPVVRRRLILPAKPPAPKPLHLSEKLEQMTRERALLFLQQDLRDPYTHKSISHPTTVGKMWQRAAEVLEYSTEKMVDTWLHDVDSAKEYLHSTLHGIYYKKHYKKYYVSVPMRNDSMELRENDPENIGWLMLQRFEKLLRMRVVLAPWNSFAPNTSLLRPFTVAVFVQHPRTRMWEVDTSLIETSRCPNNTPLDHCVLDTFVRCLSEVIHMRTHDVENLDEETKQHLSHVIDFTQVLVSLDLQGTYGSKFEQLLIELTALKEGVKLSPSPSLASASPSSANREDSLSIASDASLSPRVRGRKGQTRAQLLDQLREACTEMRDAISYEDFEDMKKKQLQLVVRIGKPTKDGKRHCYYVKNIYGLVRSAAKEKLQIRDPLDPQHQLTPAELKKIHRYVRLVVPNAKSPLRVQRPKFPQYKLMFQYVSSTAFPNMVFYQIMLRRIIGGEDYHPGARVIGYVPADIETASADVNSHVIVAKARQLFDDGKLLDARGHIRVHLNKTIDYWMEQGGARIPQKLALMVSELNQFL